MTDLCQDYMQKNIKHILSSLNSSLMTELPDDPVSLYFN